MDIDLNKFKLLEDVSKTQSLLRSSENLFLTPSAIHQGIKKLEDSLGYQLFHRTGKKYILTEEAKPLLDEYRKFYNQVVTTRDSIYQSAIQGEIKVAVPFNFSKTIFAKLITRFIQENPEIRFDIKVAETHASIIKIKDFEIDLAITDNDIPDIDLPKISKQSIHKEELVLVCSRRFFEAYEDSFSSLNKQLKLTHFSYSKDKVLLNKWYMKKTNKRKKLKFPLTHIVDNVETVLSLIYQNLGLGVVPLSMASRSIKKGELLSIELNTDVKVLNELFIVQNLDYVLNTRVRTFIDFLKSNLKL